MAKSTPLPGKNVRGSASGRPIMALLDLLGRRWTLRILWELSAGAQTFRDLQTACDGASPSVINTRLKELREARLVIHSAGEGYQLTSQASELVEKFLTLNDWLDSWARSLK